VVVPLALLIQRKKPPSKPIVSPPPTQQVTTTKAAAPPKTSTVGRHKRPLESDNVVTQPTAKKPKTTSASAGTSATTTTTVTANTSTSTSSNIEPPKFTEQDLIDVLKEHGNMKIADFLIHFRDKIGKSLQQQKYFKAYATNVTKALSDGFIGLKG